MGSGENMSFPPIAVFAEQDTFKCLLNDYSAFISSVRKISFTLPLVSSVMPE